MKEVTFTDKEAICMVSMFVMGTPLISGVSKVGKADSWICLIIAAVIALIFNLMYARLLSSYQGMNILEINESIFGKVIGTVINIIIFLYCLYAAMFIFRGTVQFMSLIGLDRTPETVTGLLIVIAGVITLKEGIKVFSRCCVFFLLTSAFVIALIIILLCSLVDFQNLTPILYQEKEVLFQAIFADVNFPLTQTFIFLILIKNLKSKKSYYKAFAGGATIAAVVLIILAIISISILGEAEYENAFYPIYMVMRRINIGDFIQRVEMAVIIVFMLYAFVKEMIYLFAISEVASHILKLDDYKFMSMPLVFLVSILSYLVYSSVITQRHLESMYPYFSWLLHLLYMTILFVICELKRKFALLRDKLG